MKLGIFFYGFRAVKDSTEIKLKKQEVNRATGRNFDNC